MNDKRFPPKPPASYVSFRILTLCAALGCICIALCALLADLTEAQGGLLAVFFAGAYLVGVALIGLLRRRDHGAISDTDVQTILEEKLSVVLKDSHTPAFFLNRRAEVVWYN